MVQIMKKKLGPKGRYTTVSIPVTLYERIKNLIDDTGFSSVSQFVIYILREIASDMEEEKISSSLTDEEKNEIIERLKKLGYI